MNAQGCATGSRRVRERCHWRRCDRNQMCRRAGSAGVGRGQNNGINAVVRVRVRRICISAAAAVAKVPGIRRCIRAAVGKRRRAAVCRAAKCRGRNRGDYDIPRNGSGIFSCCIAYNKRNRISSRRIIHNYRVL